MSNREWFWVWTHDGPARYIPADDFEDAAHKYLDESATSLPIGEPVYVAAAARKYLVTLKADDE